MMMTLSQVAAIVLVLGALAALRWAVRRTAAGRGFRWPTGLSRNLATTPVRRTASVNLTSTHTLHQVETAEGERFLLATYPGGVAVVSARPGGSTLRTQGQSA